jgi:TRAP-type C4-dicarboxylate transport system permease small subunit
VEEQSMGRDVDTERSDWHGSSTGHRIWRGFVRLQCVITGALFIWIIGVTFVNVCSRYLFTNSIVWADEAARLSFIVFSFFAAALAVATRSHLVIGELVERFPRRVRAVMLVAATLCAVSLFGLLIVGGIEQVRVNIAQASPALRIPVGYVYLAVPVSGFVMLMNLIGAWRYGPFELPEVDEEIDARMLS